MTDQENDEQNVTKEDLENIVKEYLDIKIGHFEIDSSMMLTSIRSDVYSLCELMRNTYSKILPRYQRKHKIDIEKRAEDYLHKIIEIHNDCVKVHSNIHAIFKLVKDDLFDVMALKVEISREKRDFVEFLKICEAIPKSELDQHE